MNILCILVGNTSNVAEEATNLDITDEIGNISCRTISVLIHRDGGVNGL